MKASAHGKQIKMLLACHYSKNAVYMAEKRGWVIKITPRKVERVRNGTDDQVFLFPRRYQEAQIEPREVERLTTYYCDPLAVTIPFDDDRGSHEGATHVWSLIMNGLNFMKSTMSDEDKRRLLMLYILTLFMDGLLHERVYAYILGPSGSGKTYIVRVLGRLLVGKDFQVTSTDARQDQIENALINNYFLVFDEVVWSDRKALGGSRLRMAVTGGVIERRVLYTTSGQTRIPIRAHVALTGVNSVFNEQQDTNRQLAFTLEKRTKSDDEQDLIRYVDDHRDMFLTEMAARIKLALSFLSAQQDYHPQVDVRLAGFAGLLIKLMRQVDEKDGESNARRILKAWKAEQLRSVLEENELANAISAWRQTKKFRPNKLYSAGELWDELKPHAYGADWAESAQTLGHALSQVVDACGIKMDYDNHRKQKLYAFSSVP